MRIKQRVAKLEQASSRYSQSIPVVICESGETVEQACERLEIIDKEHLLFVTFKSPETNDYH